LENTFIDAYIFGQVAPYMYVKRNSYIGVINILNGKNDKLPVSQFACCDWEKCN